MAIKVDSRRQQWLSLLRLLLPLFMMGFTAAVSSMVEHNIVSASELAERASSLHPMSVLRLISHINARKPFPGSLCKLPHLLCGPNNLHHPITLQFLPHTLSLRLPLHPHSLPHLLHMLHIPSSSPLALHMHHTLSLCNTSSLLHSSTCSSSLPHMLHFVTSTLASPRHLHILKPSLPIPSHFHHHNLTLTRVSPGPAVTCHQLLFPFAVFLCQALHESTHTLEVEIAGKEGKALVQCKKDGVCEWVREGSLVWVMKGEEDQAEANSAWLNQKFFGHLGHLMNVNIEHNNFNNSGNVSFTKSSSNTKQPSNGSQNGSGNDNANAGTESASQEPNQTGTSSTSSDGSTNSNSNASPSDGSTNSISNSSAGSGSKAINGDSSSTSTPAGSDTNSGTDDGSTGATDSSSTNAGSSKTKRPTLLHH